MPGVLVNDLHSQLNPTTVDRVVSVDSLESIQAALAAAKSEGKSLSIAGGRHAMGGQQFGSDTVLLDTVPMNRVLAFDAEGRLDHGRGRHLLARTHCRLSSGQTVRAHRSSGRLRRSRPAATA